MVWFLDSANTHPEVDRIRIRSSVAQARAPPLEGACCKALAPAAISEIKLQQDVCGPNHGPLTWTP